jgi:hypothetical protein
LAALRAANTFLSFAEAHNISENATGIPRSQDLDVLLLALERRSEMTTTGATNKFLEKHYNWSLLLLFLPRLYHVNLKDTKNRFLSPPAAAWS